LHRFESEWLMIGRRGGSISVAQGKIRAGNYLKKLDEARKTNPPKRGEVRHVDVAHDDRCSLIKGGGPCDCEPSIEILGREQ
jgi:hypothetical protein